MRQTRWQRLAHGARRLLRFFLNPRLLLCFGIGWMITNGWCYLFLLFGARYGIGWMLAVGGAYAAFLWFPFTPEKIVTVAIALFLLRLLFPHDKATLAVLQEEARKAKAGALRVKEKRRARRTARGMRRAIVIGCPGSGKSTFSRALSEASGLPLVHLDLLFWRADKTTVSEEEFDRQLAEALAREAWIIDGNYMRTLERRLAAADTVFFLDYPAAVCEEGIRARQGIPRPDMPWVEEGCDGALLSLVQGFAEGQRPAILALLTRQKRKRCITFRTREEAERFLALWREEK